jgi:hypothetical protein
MISADKRDLLIRTKVLIDGKEPIVYECAPSVHPSPPPSLEVPFLSSHLARCMHQHCSPSSPCPDTSACCALCVQLCSNLCSPQLQVAFARVARKPRVLANHIECMHWIAPASSCRSFFVKSYFDPKEFKGWVPMRAAPCTTANEATTRTQWSVCQAWCGRSYQRIDWGAEACMDGSDASRGVPGCAARAPQGGAAAERPAHACTQLRLADLTAACMCGLEAFLRLSL